MLRDVISLIENQYLTASKAKSSLNLTPEKIALLSKDQFFEYILQQIVNVLNRDDNALDPAPLQELLCYLECIPVTNIHKKTESLLDTLLTLGLRTIQTTITAHVKLSEPLSFEQMSMLYHIHQMILSKFPWHYVYPRELDGQVMNDAIRKWQQDRLRIDPDEPKAANKDFLRGTTINSVDCKSEDAIEEQLRILINSACKDKDKALLYAWLRANGGQFCDRFTYSSLADGHFTNDKKGEGPIISDAKGLMRNWFVSKKGEICYEFITMIKKLVYSGNTTRILFNNAFNKLQEELDFDKVPEDSYPLLRIQSKLTLRIVVNEVIPCVIEYKVLNYAEGLCKPHKIHPTPNNITKFGKSFFQTFVTERDVQILKEVFQKTLGRSMTGN